MTFKPAFRPIQTMDDGNSEDWFSTEIFIGYNDSNATADAFMSTTAAVTVNASSIKFLLNVTQDFPLHYALPLLGYIMPLLLLITIAANSLVIIVLFQRHMRTPTNLVLLAMAISDLLTLIFPAPWYFYMYTLGYHSKFLHPPSACYAYHYMIEILPGFFHTASIWLTLILAGQRYIYVCHLSESRRWCTVPRVLRATCLAYTLSFLHQLSRFFDRDFQSVQFVWKDQIHVGCKFETADWVKRTLTENVYFICYYGFRILFVHLGPCTALVVLNILLFHALKETQRKRLRLFNENRKSECRRLRDSNCTTLMLIVVVTLFLAVEIPVALATVVHVLQNALEWDIMDYDSLNTTMLFTNFFIMLSYPLNFAIYCGMSRQFRETFSDLFLARNRIAVAKGSSKYCLVNGPRTSTNETIL